MEFLFFLFSSIILTGGLVVITARNPIHSVLFMMLVFINVVFLLLFLEVEFLSLTFVIVYVGAVAVLFLFVVMMLNIKITELTEIVHYLPIGGFVGFIFLFDIFLLLLMNGVGVSSNPVLMSEYNYTDWFALIDSPSNMEVLGQLIYSYHAYYFILCGLVLLVAMIGAIVLTIQNKDKSIRVQQVFHQLSRKIEKAIFKTKLK